MIRSMRIHGVSTYARPVDVTGLRELNIFFGGNGTGKSTLSYVLEAPGDHPGCEIGWDGAPLPIIVYNERFKRRAFFEDPMVEGVFTLGEDNATTRAELEKARNTVESMEKQIATWQHALNGDNDQKGLRSRQADADENLRKLLWERRKKYAEHFRDALRGTHTMVLFAQAALNAWKIRGPVTTVPTFDDLRARAQVVLDQTTQRTPTIPRIGVGNLATLTRRAEPLLAMRIVGHTEVDLRALIEKLDHSTWVDHGRKYLTVTNGVCPFCQQPAPNDLATRLEALFDHRYAEQTQLVATIHDAYRNEVDRIEREIQAALASPVEHMDTAGFENAQLRLLIALKANLQKLHEKVVDPSVIRVLEPLRDLLGQLNVVVDEANVRIAAHNELVDNRKTATTQLQTDLWTLIVHDLSVDLEQYQKQSDETAREIKALESRISGTNSRRLDLLAEIRAKEATLTGTRDTARRINDRLAGCGFTGFRLEPTADDSAYTLVRPGSANAAAKSLSEGERTFVSFLYFHQMVRTGSRNRTTIVTPRVVVIDDPISSLDGEVMYVVAALVQQLVEDTRAKTSPIAQLFLLTHNAHFHHTVAQRLARPNSGWGERTTWWLVGKKADVTHIESRQNNPVRTSYQMLWAEYFRGRSANPPPPGLPNTMRRILEYWFTVLGHTKLNEITDGLDLGDVDTALAASLVPWAHDHSHGFLDDARPELSPEQVARYCTVFERIFRARHSSHWEMMERTVGAPA